MRFEKCGSRVCEVGETGSFVASPPANELPGQASEQTPGDLRFAARICATLREGRIMKTGVNVTFRVPIWLDKIFTWPVMLYRKHKYGWPFRKIPLGEGEFSIVSPNDYYLVRNFNWYLGSNGREFYAFRNVKNGPGKTKMVSMHRQIMDFPKGLLVDHRNGDTLDNRRSNLRPATHAQNMHNCRKMKNTSSQYRGVSFVKERGLFASQITNKGKRISLGRYKSEIDAARAYDAAARKYFGEFARLNFPD